MHAAEAALVATGALALTVTNAATVLVARSAAVLMAWRARERRLTCSRPSDTLALRKRPSVFFFFFFGLQDSCASAGHGSRSLFG